MVWFEVFVVALFAPASLVPAVALAGPHFAGSVEVLESVAFAELLLLLSSAALLPAGPSSAAAVVAAAGSSSA